MSRDVTPIFAAIDAMDAEKFVSYLTPDVKFRFANNEPALGRAAVTEGVEGFWSMIGGLTHHILAVHEIGDIVVAQIAVEYLRKDGKSVTVPNCDDRTSDGDLRPACPAHRDLPPALPSPAAPLTPL